VFHNHCTQILGETQNYSTTASFPILCNSSELHYVTHRVTKEDKTFQRVLFIHKYYNKEFSCQSERLQQNYSYGDCSLYEKCLLLIIHTYVQPFPSTTRIILCRKSRRTSFRVSLFPIFVEVLSVLEIISKHSWTHSASNRNEYQVYFPGIKAAGA
jgi:hypothetical protein